MKFNYAHTNLSSFDLDKSIAFYEENLGLKEVRRKVADDDSFILAYMGDGITDYEIELTWYRDWKEPYKLGDNEIHLCFHVDDYEAAHALHEKNGVICFENHKMGLYFINDPDGFWIEILPKNR